MLALPLASARDVHVVSDYLFFLSMPRELNEILAVLQVRAKMVPKSGGEQSWRRAALCCVAPTPPVLGDAPVCPSVCSAISFAPGARPVLSSPSLLLLLLDIPQSREQTPMQVGALISSRLILRTAISFTPKRSTL